jgi:phenylacetate-CoA ligase
MLFTPDGRHIPGEFFPHLIKEYAEVRRFQVVQEAHDSICLRLVVSLRWTAAQQQSLVEEIRNLLGTAVHFHVDVVDDIPLTRSGKLRVVVNECDQRQVAAATEI